MNIGWITPGKLTLATACVALAVTGCTVGPNYTRPSVRTPAAYSSTSNATQAIPAPAWWTIYHDPTLDALVAQVRVSNQSLKAAAARVQEAHALLDATRGERLPGVGIGTFKVGRRNRSDFGIGVSWELDFWGRIRRSIQVHQADTQASADDLAAATLSMQAQVVQSYFAWREKNALIGWLQKVVTVDTRWARMVHNQHAAGVASSTELTRAQTRLGNARTQLANATIARARFKHAIAVMLGRPPEGFSIAPGKFDTRVPAVPSGLPSTLLKRRPDIAAAERRMAAASAQIGVRTAERYPSIKLVAGVGVLHGLFATPSVQAPLYEGGTLKANVAHARAAYAEAVAKYRNTVLNAFREVEDNLTAQNALARAAPAVAASARSARHMAQSLNRQMQAGVASQKQLVQAQAAALDSVRAQLALHLQRLDASVDLIKALGGGWHAGDNTAATAATSTAPARHD